MNDSDNPGEFFRNLSRNLQELDRSHNIPFSELFPEEFVKQHTKFTSIYKLFEAGGFNTESAESFKAITDEDLDRFVAENTDFKTWSDMKDKAAAEWVKKKMFRPRT